MQTAASNVNQPLELLGCLPTFGSCISFQFYFQNLLQHMHGRIPYVFDCLVVHNLLLPKERHGSNLELLRCPPTFGNDIGFQFYFQNLLASHDIVAQRDYLPKLNEVPIEVDEDEETVKIVQLVKSQEPLVSVPSPTSVSYLIKISQNKFMQISETLSLC